MHTPLHHADESGGLLKERPTARNAKTNAPCPPRQPLLMFKVMRRDRLIKRRLRDAPGAVTQPS